MASQHSTKGDRPKMLGSRYTMPQRDTVAGEATAKSITSNIIVWFYGIREGKGDEKKAGWSLVSG